jgi:hypothetical protein
VKEKTMKGFMSAVISAIALIGYSSATSAAGVSFAVVSDGGTLVRGDNATNAKRLGTGNYTVTFNQSVRHCAFVASLGSTGTATPPTGSASVGADSSSDNKVHIATRNHNANNSDRSFHLMVVCP